MEKTKSAMQLAIEKIEERVTCLCEYINDSTPLEASVNYDRRIKIGVLEVVVDNLKQLQANEEKEQIIEAIIEGFDFVAVHPHKYRQDAELIYNDKYGNQ